MNLRWFYLVLSVLWVYMAVSSPDETIRVIYWVGAVLLTALNSRR